MESGIIEDRVIEKASALDKAEYENCRFVNKLKGTKFAFPAVLACSINTIPCGLSRCRKHERALQASFDELRMTCIKSLLTSPPPFSSCPSDSRRRQ